VDDTVHVQIEVVKLREERRVRDDMVDLGVAFANPSVELESQNKWKTPDFIARKFVMWQE